MREQRLVLGEVADDYDDVRAPYADEVATAVFDYAGGPPRRMAEIGAGTGKATELFVARGIPIVCVEPDPAMAAVLRRRFPSVEVMVSRFEDWAPPPGGVPLLACAQAWHWMEPATRHERAHAALSPGGVLALFGHEYGFADADLAADVKGAYLRHAPELLDPPAAAEIATELTSALFVDERRCDFERIVAYPTQRYIRLLTTFSSHRLRPDGQRRRLHAAIAEVVDRHGGVVAARVHTVLTMSRRAPDG